MTAPRDQKTGVVLIHGLGRTRFSMWPLARRLRRAGWEVALAAYPSLRLPIETSVRSLLELIWTPGCHQPTT